MDLLRNRSQAVVPNTKATAKNPAQWRGRGSFEGYADEGQGHRSKIHDSRGTAVGMACYPRVLFKLHGTVPQTVSALPRAGAVPSRSWIASPRL